MRLGLRLINGFRYYNGTTTIRIEPQDIFPDTECDTFAKAVEVSYENSVLAIIESDRSVPDNNKVTFALKYWDKSLNVVPEAARLFQWPCQRHH